MSRILTSINEPVIVLVVGVGAVSFLLEMHGCNTLGLAIRIVV